MNWQRVESPEPEGRQRLFLAIPLPVEIRELLVALQPEASPNRRLANAAQMHITLQFLGEVGAATAKRIREKLPTPGIPRFELQLAGVGAFRRHRDNAVYWADIKPASSLQTLHHGLGVALCNLDVLLAKGRYRPHITLARFRRPEPDCIDALCQRHADFSARFVVTGYALYRSELRPSGVVHHPLENYALK